MSAGFAQKHQQADDQQDGKHLPAGEQTSPAPDRYRYKYPHNPWPWLSQKCRGRSGRRSAAATNPAIPYHRGTADQTILEPIEAKSSRPPIVSAGSTNSMARHGPMSRAPNGMF